MVDPKTMEMDKQYQEKRSMEEAAVQKNLKRAIRKGGQGSQEAEVALMERVGLRKQKS